MSGTTLIVIAIAAFVLLVSAQVFNAWPIAALGGSGAHISDARATAEPAAADTTTAADANAATAPHSTGSRPAGKRAGGANQTANPEGDIASSDTAPVAGEPGGGGNPSGGNQGGSNSPSQSPASNQSPSGSQSTSSSSGGKSSSGSAASTATGKVTETVNGVDEAALGGTLGKTGVTEATENVVEGVVGPESPVGHAVDETVNAVGGLLDGTH